jgi:cell division initiation protein
MIGPEDIERVVFKERFRGYDPDQVDSFLDDVAASLGELRRERDELAERVAGTSAATAPVAVEGGEVDVLLRRTLADAQRTADDVVAQARRAADELLAEAGRAVERERDEVRAEAELLRRAVEDLRGFRDEYRARLHDVLGEQLAALDRVGELPRLPRAVEKVLGQAEPADASSDQDRTEEPETAGGS